MIKKSALTANLIGGLDVSLDPTFLAETSSPNLAGVSFDKALIKKDTGRAAWGTPINILANPGFELGNLTGWTAVPSNIATVSNAHVHSGNYSCKVDIDVGNGYGGVQQIRTVIPGANYTFSSWIYNTANAANACSLYVSDGAIEYGVESNSTDELEQLTLSFTANSNQVTVGITTTANSMYVDDANLAGPTLNEYIMFLDAYPTRDGSIHYVIATPSNMYRYLANTTF